MTHTETAAELLRWQNSSNRQRELDASDLEDSAACREVSSAGFELESAEFLCRSRLIQLANCFFEKTFLWGDIGFHCFWPDFRCAAESETIGVLYISTRLAYLSKHRSNQRVLFSRLLFSLGNQTCQIWETFYNSSLASENVHCHFLSPQDLSHFQGLFSEHVKSAQNVTAS